MKIKSAPKHLCTYCISIKRHKKIYIYCSKNFKHKQRQK
uniref:Ribosomal protein n=1 Tax=Cyclospora cayetanensis TaxID=88456 RepID=A0A193BMN4_9EIME|nr:ribosomal protein L36 [Cyclospora cayetanensis]ANN13273.1 ribosomal protein L36 [Cyclospora cayetanensis]ANN13302.1 ribosomal protein L36 [Cyclospora cayetanensis]ANN13331.1 ribosomal protein L36 [Cyclospora cayetanensis]ANN13360.1 ribosomal protein L36 [Cyclospora cayetanensis]